ncbi:MAG: hypothetical protein ACREUS_08860 [Burkholderiales bacterium]
MFVPQTTIVYDEKCRIHTKHMTLRGEQIAAIGHCAGDACLAVLATIGIVAGASVVVSGSIVVVGNVVYWIEKQGQCLI